MTGEIDFLLKNNIPFIFSESEFKPSTEIILKDNYPITFSENGIEYFSKSFSAFYTHKHLYAHCTIFILLQDLIVICSLK